MKFGIDPKLGKRIAALAIPTILGMVIETLVNQVDTAFVGRLPEPNGINGHAAIGLSMIVFWGLGGFFAAVVVGTQAIAARRFGENQMELAGQALTNSLLISIVCGLTASIVGWIVIPKVFPYLNPNPDVVRLGTEYCQIRMLNIFSMVTTFSFKGFFDAIGKTYVHMVASIIMNVSNIFLAYGLIFGHFGLPRMEVGGAAWATLVATYMGLAVMVYWSLKKKYRSVYRYFRKGNIKRHIIWEIVRLSVPYGLATMFLMSGFGFFLWSVGQTGKGPSFLETMSFIPMAGPVLHHLDIMRPDLATSASWVMMSFLMAVFMVSIAFGTATATLVGQSLGAKDTRLAERYGWESTKIGMYFMGTLGLVVIFFPHMFLRIFTDKVAEIETAVPPLRLIASTFSLVSAGLILVQALNGAGNSKFVMKAEFILHLFCLIPLSYLLGVVLDLGLLGTWSAAATYIVLLSSIMAWKFYEGKWKDIKL